MAEINFLPVCSNCKKVILVEVNVEYVDVWSLNEKLASKEPIIYPGICPYCGAYFDSITIPGTLPFKVNIDE